MKLKVTPLTKFIGIVIAVGALGFGIHKMGWLDGKQTQASSVPPKVDVGGSPQPVVSHVSQPSVLIPAATLNYTPKLMTIAWNATLGLQYANGGPTTVDGSLMGKRGVNLSIVREDDYAKQKAEIIAFAQEIAKGNMQPKQGAAFTIIMGDGYPDYVASLQDQLSKIGQQIQVVMAVGYSRGEDKCMLPPAVKADPQKARGSLIGAVLRDGDWLICVKWAGDNGIPVNPDEETYDPDAMNFVSVNSFTEADEKYIAGGACHSRPIVKNGVRTGEKRQVCQNGTATWTPGDVNIARKKGGLVAVASTKEYAYQMPAVVIGNKAWMEANRVWVANFITSALEGGEIVRSNDQALMKAAGIAAKVFNEESAEFWAKYYKGVTEQDRTGQLVQLGGSTTNGFADNAYLFGLNGNDNLYQRVYTLYGGLVVKYYPKLVPQLVPYEQVVNTNFLKAALSQVDAAPVQAPTFNAAVPGTVVAKRNYSIEFDTGRATFTPAAVRELDQVLNSIATSSLAVQINGHTDNVGNQESNIELSKKRADAVKNFLMQNSNTITAQRVTTRGYGDTQPVADNTSAAGKAKNRRVEIILLDKSN